MTRRLAGLTGIAALELNISCPNVSAASTSAPTLAMCERLIADCRASTETPIIAKLTPNVTSIPVMARAAAAGGADAISLNQYLPWYGHRLAAPAATVGQRHGGPQRPGDQANRLRAVFQAAQVVKTPIIGIGGIATIDDVMEFLVAGASAVQLGTVNFYNLGRLSKCSTPWPGGASGSRGSMHCRRRRKH